ncbi:Retrovirus-related Pol polyprotein from transposon TNT 1-94 [Araneus ventricosus]|uniref:Retrovirus-related Pol polyprotein from transposon TNT 1-94 n=1 Tax=Araneus ventricosus TaxID=182803 RepID=A0A4Y2TPV5_ARAVE|nr:Retrovirus-related Pol polyprotein from transposon TNT 1-94 [Araneus ventricosus]
MTRARVIQLLDEFFGTKYQPGEDVGIFLCRMKTAASRLQEEGHKVDDLYLGFQMIKYLPQEFQSTVQQIYRWKDGEFTAGKIEAELILEANRLQLMKQDLEKTETVFLSSASTSRKSSAVPGGADAVPGDASGNKWYQKEDCKVFVKHNKTTKRLEKKGAHFVGSKGKIHVYNKDWNKLFLAVRRENLYFFKPTKYITPKPKEINSVSNITSKTKSESMKIWHELFCHINNEYLVKTSKINCVRGLPSLTDDRSHCIPCKLAKPRRVSFKKTGAVRSKRPLKLLHMDLCGSMPALSLGGNKYFFTIIDDYSRKVTVFPINRKSDVFQTFLKFQRRAERFLGRKIVSVKNDGGLEFCDKDLDNFLEQQGINHEKTNPYTPEQNGVAERFNLTALDGVKTLLKSSGVAQKFWGEALLCFTYTWNRVCHKDGNKTPFEKYSGKKPSVSHLKPFGCLAYVGVPKQIRKKLDM